MIRPATSQDLEWLTRIHLNCLPGLLTRLGPAVVRAYYEGALQLAHVISYVDVEHERMRGFVFGSASPSRLGRDTLRQNVWRLVPALALAVLRDRKCLNYLVKSTRPAQDKGFDRLVPELTYLAVSQEFRGGGVGSRLVEAFSSGLKVKGFRVYELSVDLDNTTAVRFYEKEGFDAVGEYQEFGKSRRRYRLNLSKR